MDNLIGKTLSNRYRIGAFLGCGGMAEVYKAWDKNRSIYLALKLLHNELAHDKIFLQRFLREAQTLAKLQHPNIVRFYGIETDNLIVFMLMDYIEGATLKTEIFQAKGTPLIDRSIAHIIKSVCSALHYAHQQGLIHCDIKPANILINQSGGVFLSDFGIARVTDTATVNFSGSGTPAYMAPELVMGYAPSIQSDIYALGIILYEMVTGGERPFTGETAQVSGPLSEQVRWEHNHIMPPSPRSFNPAISNVIETVIMRCLAKTPGERFNSALELGDAIQRLTVSGLYTASGFQHGYTPSNQPKQKIKNGSDKIFQRNHIRSVEKPTKDFPQRQIIQRQISRNAIWVAMCVVFVIFLIVGVSSLGTQSNRLPTKSSVGIGSTMNNPVDSAVMVFVPEGVFFMGSLDRNAHDDEKPEHLVYQDDFWIYQHEVTNDQFNEFVSSTKYITTAENRGYSHEFEGDSWVQRPGAYWAAPSGPGSSVANMGNHPVVHISWDDANAYCIWIGGRLPTEAEWEKAARSADRRKFPWGNSPVSGDKVNFCDVNCLADWADSNQDDGFAMTAPVGSFTGGVSPYDALDMAGNVWEWVADRYGADYYKNSPYRNPKGPSSGNYRVLRGGSWIDSGFDLRVSFRDGIIPEYSTLYNGFRCAVDL